MTTRRSEPQGLVKLDQATRLLAEASSAADIPDKVQPVIDLAAQMALLARQRDMGLEAINHAAGLKLRAEHRAGQLLADADLKPGRPVENGQTLRALGVDKDQSSRWQKLASVPVDVLEGYVADCTAQGVEATSAGAQKLTATPKPVPESNGKTAAPLLRFMPPESTSAEIVTAVLAVCFPDAVTAIDVTYGSGAFWDGSAHVEVTGHDLDPQRAASGPMDFCAPWYADQTFDVSLFDPPHLADAGQESIMGQRFGTAEQTDLLDLIRRGTRATWQLASLGMIVKVTDHVHGQVFQSESDAVRQALEWMPVYEQVHQIRSYPLLDPKWGEQLSAYNNGSTYLVFRRGSQRHVSRRAPE